MIGKRAYKTGIVLLLALSVSQLWAGMPETVPASDGRDLILATTTSFQDSGLLDILLKLFTESTGIRVKAIAVGSGEAIRMGEQGSADVLVVHSPADEEAFMKAGFGQDRKELMSNDFVIVGPKNDPAGVRGLSTVEAFRNFAEKNAVFVSRADNSGTHKKEKAIWKKTGLDPKGAWYVETGQGMAESLRIASEKSGYALTDRGTYLAVKGRLDLEIVVEGEKDLLNIYHVITIHPARFPMTNIEGAKAFMNFLLEPKTQRIIGDYGREKYGRALFVPAH